MKLNFRTALLACTLALGTLTVTSCYNDDTIEEAIILANTGGEGDPYGGNTPPDSMQAEEEKPLPEGIASR
ncbi:MAG TPA: hypothetical protein DCE41_31540 [Cytophagales bacterium]|nr:hypothetical protein [Cytophagales bacterium]HAA18992.1 hypothetical protein [Cytophagales bacterium]HAP61831.1 hypothetical protein [Cytophagales bacterium]